MTKADAFVLAEVSAIKRSAPPGFRWHDFEGAMEQVLKDAVDADDLATRRARLVLIVHLALEWVHAIDDGSAEQ